MRHTQQNLSRGPSALLTAAFGILLSAVCCFLLATTSVGAPGVVLAVFGAAGAAYSIYFWVHPVAWTIELSDESLRWRSPHLPRFVRELALSEIAAAWTSPTETEAVELRLTSGELVSIPPSCVPRPRELVSALHAANPKIRDQTQ